MTATLRQQITGDETTVVDDDSIEPPEEAMDNNDPEQEQKEKTFAEEQAETHAHWREVLQAPTPPGEVLQRAAMRGGGAPVLRADGSPLMLDYVTARFVMSRLDAAVGSENWQTQFETLHNTDAVRCGIGIRIPDTDTWVWKWDVGIPTMIEPQKGAHSDALKRAAVQWGIARDLYDTREEERQNSAPPVQQPVVAAAATPNVQPAGTLPQYTQDTQPTSATAGSNWMCPLHNDVKIVPAGTSKKTGKPYNAFYACPVPGCDQTGPRA